MLLPLLLHPSLAEMLTELSNLQSADCDQPQWQPQPQVLGRSGWSHHKCAVPLQGDDVQWVPWGAIWPFLPPMLLRECTRFRVCSHYLCCSVRGHCPHRRTASQGQHCRPSFDATVDLPRRLSVWWRPPRQWHLCWGGVPGHHGDMFPTPPMPSEVSTNLPAAQVVLWLCMCAMATTSCWLHPVILIDHRSPLQHSNLSEFFDYDMWRFMCS
jgi:hypothetical protein